MKNSSKKLLLLLLLLALIIFILCWWFGLCAGAVTRTDPVKTPIAISFLKAKVPFDEKVANVVVTIHDPGGQIVNSRGLPIHRLALDYGVMSIAFKKDTEFSEQSPYRFTVHAEADGYVENVQTFLISDDQPQHRQIFMASLEDSPASLATNVVNLPIDRSGGVLSQPVSLSASFGKGPAATLQLPAGLQFFCEGKPVTDFDGPAQVSMAIGTPTGFESNLIFPNGFSVIDAVDREGKPLATPQNPFYFTSFGWATIELKLGDFRVDSFSTAVSLTIPVFPLGTPEPATGAEDSIALFSTPMPEEIAAWTLDNTTGRWQEELSTQIKSDPNGSRFASFPINHLSTWNLDLKGPDACRESDVGALRIAYTNTTCPQVLYSRLLYNDPVMGFTFVPATPTSAGLTRSFNLTYRDTDVGTGPFEVTIANYPNNPNLQFRVYTSESAAASDTPLATTGAINGCQDFTDPSATPITLSIPSGGGTCDVINLNFSLLDGSTEVNPPICNNAVWYRIVNTPYNTANDTDLTEWDFAGIIDGDGNLLTSAFDFSPGTQDVRLLIWWHNGAVDQSIRFTLPDNASSFATCGALGTATQVGQVTSGAVTATPLVTLSVQCHRLSGNTSPDCSPSGGYNCSTQATSATERGLNIVVENLPSGFSFPICGN